MSIFLYGVKTPLCALFTYISMSCFPFLTFHLKSSSSSLYFMKMFSTDFFLSHAKGGGDIDPYSEVLRHSFTSSSTYLFCNPGISMYPCGYFSSTSNVVFMYGPIIPMYVRYLSTLPLKAWHWILLNCGPKSIYLSLAFLSEQRRYLTHSILAISTPNHSLATVKPSSSSTSTLK